jgi:Flp pilus assembly pilin Flp
MTVARENLRRLSGDEAGQTTIEWAMILVAFGIPMISVFGMLLSVLSEHYRMVTFLQMLPFP